MADLTKLAAVLLLLGGTACSPSLDWFLTPDQQGRLWLERGEPLRAARTFEDRLWKGLAYAEAGDMASAASALAVLDTARGKFEYGNALARQERLPEAIAAYERALASQPEFPEATFNLDWVRGLLELDRKEYEDAGGTGGKLEADKIVFDEKGAKGKGEMTSEEARAQGLSEEQLREMWMRRVQTTPADFLRLKFSFQDQTGSTP
ncbi:MAG: tetratricopeptide repeat protein [bacterium]|nr:tetratricopeptide repeat protein [bacterium]